MILTYPAYLLPHPFGIDYSSSEDPIRRQFVTSNTGATADFLDTTCAKTNSFPCYDLEIPRQLEGFDGQPAAAGLVTQYTRIWITIPGYPAILTTFFLTPLPNEPVILGLPWLEQHRATIRLRPEGNTISLELPPPPKGTEPKVVPITSNPPAPQERRSPLEIRLIGAAPFAHVAKQPGIELFSATMRDIEKALAPKTRTDPATILPLEYHDYLSVFSQSEADKLPSHRPCDHKIELQPGKEPSYGPLYNMSQDELKVLKKFLDENLAKGFIRPSTSPAASPVLFARKPGGGLRLCVDYRALNAITVKNRYPLPLIQETLDRICRAKYFTKLDIIAAFNKIRMAMGEEWKTAFRTRYGLYESLVMPFGLANAPSTFQGYINSVLHEYLDNFCTAYIDDILIYSNSKAEHREHVRKVLERLREAGLQVDIDKCAFSITEVKYLGLIITTRGIQMDPEKVSAVVDWLPPKNVKDVQSFLGFTNFYRRFIQGFSAVASPLTKLTKKDHAFSWTPEC